MNLESILNGDSIESVIIGAVVAALIFGISKLPTKWKKRTSEVIDKVDEKLDESSDK